MNVHIIPALVRDVGDCQTCYGSSTRTVYRVLFGLRVSGLDDHTEIRMCAKCIYDFNRISDDLLKKADTARKVDKRRKLSHA